MTDKPPMTSTETSATNAPAAKPRNVFLPRMAIHAFCEDQATADILGVASTDRRLIKAHLTVQMGGIHVARGFYEKAPTPNLIIVESLLDGTAMLADLEKLALVCEADTKVLVVGHVNDVLLYRELMRRGVSDYLVPPFTAEEVADGIVGVFAEEPAPAPGRVMAFIGAKGGAGSSTVCHNVGWTLAETLASDTIIADLDLAFGTAGLNFNQDPPQGAGDALAAPERLDEALAARLLAKCSDRLSLLGAGCDLARSIDVTPEGVAKLLDVLSRSAANVVLDLPRLWTPWLSQILAQADDVVITAEPDLANLRNTKNLLDAIASLRAKDRLALLVLNKANIARRPEISARDFANALDLSPAAVIDFDPALFGAAANNGLMIGEAARKAKAVEQFRMLATALARKLPAPPRGEGLFGPLLNRLRKRSA
jgi:pilus assembly protein CpaE